MAFKIAASMATKKLAQQGGAVLLEPIMTVSYTHLTLPTIYSV